jgi:hypothetical protein
MSGWHEARAAVLAAALAATIALLIWAYGTALRAPALGLYHDDGVYAVTAQALATGRGYRIVSLPREIPQTKYPILFPALLAAVWKIYPRFPGNLVWLKLVPFLAAILWGALAYRLIRAKTGSAGIAAALTTLFAISPWVLFLGTTLLSETLFAALTTGALLVLGRVDEGHCGWREMAGAGALTGAAFLTRTAGAAGILAGVLVIGMRAGWRRALGFLAVAGAFSVPWLVWQIRGWQAAGPLEAYYAAANYGQWDIVFHFTAAQKMTILGQNLLGAWLSPAGLAGVPATRWGAGLAILAGGLVAAGWWRRAVGKRGAAEILAAIYTAMIVTWAWPPERFLAPLWPVFLLYGYEGARHFCRRLARIARGPRVALAMLAAAFAVSSVLTLVDMARSAQQTGAVPVPNLAQDDWRETDKLLGWLDRHTPADAIFMGNLDPALYLYTGRKSVRGFPQDPYRLHYDSRPGDQPLGSAGEMRAAIGLSHAGYLICTPNLGFRESAPLAQLTQELVRGRSREFELVYESGDARYRVYRIHSQVFALSL